ncbi:M23 family metallopeptidase [Flavobacteriaceae bacterium]|nr:M23 family metallopeptidase [Flavobacteriaceae bacterium]
MKSKVFTYIAIITTIFFICDKSLLLFDIKKEKNLPVEQNYAKFQDKQQKIQQKNYLTDQDYLIQKGDSIINILAKINIPYQDSIEILNSLKKSYNPNKLKIGQIIKIQFFKTPSGVILQNLTINPYQGQSIVLTKLDNNKYQTKKISNQLYKHIVKYKGELNTKKGDNSIFDAMIRARIPIVIINNIINMYSFDIDFGRDIHNKTKFEIVFEEYYNKNNIPIKTGKIIYSSLALGGSNKKKLNFYAYKINNKLEYFDIDGNSIRKSLLKTPINGARISSGFGLRRHPILGYSKMHKGIDFAAPRGTPIFAAGSGTVKYSGWKGSYGKYVKIRHNSEYQTAYAHLSKIPRNIKNGKKVKQGNIIGYVGTTGRSTGPHLHYEILRRGKQINPSKVRSTPGIKLSKSKLKKFRNSVIYKIDKYRNNIPNQSII